MRAFNIQPLDTKAMETCRYRIDNLTKPIYSLAMLTYEIPTLSSATSSLSNL